MNSAAVWMLLLQACVVQGFAGFYTTNYNETITVCVFDQARGVLLGRTHWPNTPFNEDSAALQGVVVSDKWFYGAGATITGGAYSFSVELKESAPMDPIGSFNFLDKEENGVWSWTYVRPTIAEECDMVTAVREVQDGHGCAAGTLTC